jgi:hypothetical protein
VQTLRLDVPVTVDPPEGRPFGDAGDLEPARAQFRQLPASAM